MRKGEYLRLYAVTDSRWLGAGEKLSEACEKALRGGATCIQLRDKELTGEALLAEAREIKEVCSRYGAPFIMNDDVETALAAGADGLHLGQEDLAGCLAGAGNCSSGNLKELLHLPASMLLGISAHTAEEALAAERAGADYLGVGAVFATGTKDDAHTLSEEDLQAIRGAVDLPLVGIGGLTAENIPALGGRGLSGFAVVSAIFRAQDKELAARELSGIINTVLAPPVLSVAGSDSSGGAGIQADLKTMTALGVYGMTAVAALTAQNTVGVTGAVTTEPSFLAAQMKAVFEDIPPRAVKTGMIPSAELVRTIASELRKYRAVNVVVDPVMVATSGAVLAEDEAVSAMKQDLFPLARVITPNIPETERLLGRSVKSRADMEQAAVTLGEKCGCAVLVKGGHSLADADDVLFDSLTGSVRWLYGKRIESVNTHGTGCTLSSAIASFLALGWPLPAAVRWAKDYLSSALSAGFNLGRGSGPLYHMIHL